MTTRLQRFHSSEIRPLPSTLGNVINHFRFAFLHLAPGQTKKTVITQTLLLAVKGPHNSSSFSTPSPNPSNAWNVLPATAAPTVHANC